MNFTKLQMRTATCSYFFISIFAIFLLLNVGAHAQFTTARLSGTIVDSSGSFIGGASVSIVNVDTGYAQATKSGSVGEYVFPSLPVGLYRLSVTAEGFSPYVQNGLQLTVNQAATQQVTLKVGSAVQQVSVSANASMVTTDSPVLGQLIDQKNVVDLPLNGREVQQLVFLIPGAVDVSSQNCASGCQGGVVPGEQYAKINGGGANGVYYLLDGVDYNDTYINTNIPFPNPDAIQEFNIQTTNMSAVYGNATGGVVNVVTKSGTDRVHGSAFEFLRNYAADARNYFATDPDPLKQNQFGGSIGGPILKHKLFYFGSYQGTRRRTAANGQVAFVPTLQERQGDFSDLLPDVQLKDPTTGIPYANNQLPSLSPVTQYLLQHIPLPNGPGRQLTYNGSATIENTNEYLAKADYDLGKHHISGHYFQLDYSVPLVSSQAATTNILVTDTNQPQDLSVKHVSIQDIWPASDKLLLSSFFGYTKETGTTLSSVPFTIADAGSLIAQPPNKGNGNLPVMTVNVAGGINISNVPYGHWDHGDQSFREVVTWVKGRSQLSFGGEELRITLPMGHTYQENGSFSFSNGLTGDNTADFVLGRVSTFSQGGGYYLDFSGVNWSAFVQEEFKVSPRLSLSGGLRWDPYFPLTDTLGRVACFVPGAQSVRYPNAPVGLLFGGDNHDAQCPKSSIFNNPNNWGPRIGFASQLTADGKTSLRGGAGMYYEGPPTVWLQDIVGIPPFSPLITLTSVDFRDPYGSAGVPNPFPEQFGPRNPGPDAAFPADPSFYAIFDRHFRLPMILTWNLTAERGLSDTWLARVAYLGNKADHLAGTGDQESGLLQINPAIYGPGATADNTQSRRVYPTFGVINSINSGIDSNYHSLQLTLEKRLSHGYAFLTNFTWSKALNDFAPAGGGGTNSCSCGRQFDYGPDTGDVSKVFRLSGSYELPHAPLRGVANKIINGWQMSGIASWHSGFPFTIFSNQDNSFSALGGDRADLNGKSVQEAILSTGRSHSELVNQWFDTTVFKSNVIGTFGDTGKNILRGPRYFNTDLVLSKSFVFEKSFGFQLRAEAYNAFNNVNFGLPDHGLLDGGFGQITDAAAPRILQLAGKITF